MIAGGRDGGKGKLSEGSRNMDKLGGMPRMWNGS